MGKFGQSIGILELEVGEVNFSIKPRMGDNYNLQKIMMDNKYKNDNATRMKVFGDWIVDILRRDNPDEPENEIREFVEFNILKLFEEIIIGFKWTTREEFEKSKESDIKKLIGES